MIFSLVLAVCRELCVSKLDRFQCRMSRRLCVWLKMCNVVFRVRWREVGSGLALASASHFKNRNVPLALVFHLFM